MNYNKKKDENTRYNIVNFLDNCFWLSSLAWGLLTILCFVQVYFFELDEKFFDHWCYAYYIFVVSYAISRKAKYTLYPTKTETRYSEYIVVGWFIITVVFGALTQFHYHGKLDLMIELFEVDAVIASVLGLGSAYKRWIIPMMKLKQFKERLEGEELTEDKND
ncbi:hypothetical protein HN858_02365 [Candidatus Falkowbacteria bacterium]|jgi:hypothetical protein|nr:hypothetical protein [Candidatus Falkowbacteria bacterium]MBT5503200.1 hypothetical protein [Candidatus Falkowbacteria bacterium]MBT6573893.1 hypothetical protein [Candidatus Falkowbacteria bacterium]MBT7348500.1 hypothetical protein [Candidatus Falkowbacteria bacterium]MBT7500835.1 hypothetical protein [Candidatus Falkowbacteria bacterium]